MTGAWNQAKVDAFRESFEEFIQHVVINSKETGGNTRLSEHIYRAQRMFLDCVFDALADDVHDIYVLKSRQLGISTITRALGLFWLLMHDGLQGSMVFDTAPNTSKARRELRTMLQGLPPRLGLTSIDDDNRDGLVLKNQSQLLFMAAGVKQARTAGGLGRSSGLNMLMASELCSWNNDEGLVSLKQSLTDVYPDRLYIWESTARGFNSWHDMWEEAKADGDNKRTLFLGWWAKDSQQISRGTPEFAKYGTPPLTDREIDRIRAVREQYGWQITPEQLAWYRKVSDPTQSADEGDPEDANFLQEQPFTEQESFQSTGSTFFQSDSLAGAMGKAANLSYQAYKFWPGLDFLSCDVRSAVNYREVELKVWEEPQQESHYVVCGDPAFGHDEKNNNSCATVLRCFADCIEQVAEYATATIMPHQFAWLLWTLVGYYSSKPNNQVMTIVELNGPGEEVWRQYDATKKIVQNGYLRPKARDLGISNIFYNARNFVFSRSDSMGVGHNVHFKTQVQIKIQIMEALRNYLHNDGILVRSMPALEEMRTITRDGDKIGAEGAKRDDRVFALALGVRAWEDKIRRGLIAQNRTKATEMARRHVSMADQFTLYNQWHLDQMFRVKATARATQLAQQRRMAWRGR